MENIYKTFGSYQRGYEKPEIEVGQTMQWSREKGQKDRQ